jgi:biotin carboxyl carrier protein
MSTANWEDVLELVRQAASGGTAELAVERPGLRLYVSTVDSVPPESTVDTPADLVPVPAPVMGTVYRRPAPDAAPFVEPGDEVGPDTTVAIVEVMKLMMPVTAEVAGRIVEVCARDGDMVEEDEPLFLIEVRP